MRFSKGQGYSARLAAGAVEVLVEGAGISPLVAQGGDDEAWIGLALGMLCFADDPPAAAPAVERRPHEVLEAPCRSTGRGALFGSLGKLLGDLLDQPRIARQAEQVVDAAFLTPRHQGLAGKTTVGTQHDPDLGPAPPNLPDDAPDLFDRAGRAIDVGAPQLGRQQMAAAEHVERQVAVTAVVAVEEPAFLIAVNEIVGSVEIEHDLLGRLRMRLKKDIDQQGLDRRRIVADLVVARRLGPAQFQPVQRRLAGCRRAVPTPRRKLAHQHRHHRIVPKPVVIDEILVAQRQAEHMLPDQRPHLVFHKVRPPAVPEARRKTIDQPDRPIGRPQQHRSGIRADRPAVEAHLNPATFHRCKSKQICATVCTHRS